MSDRVSGNTSDDGEANVPMDEVRKNSEKDFVTNDEKSVSASIDLIYLALKLLNMDSRLISKPKCLLWIEL